MIRFSALAATACILGAGQVRAEEPTPVSEVQVTATRVPEAVDRVPAFITVIRGEDLRARQITDLRTALALVSGVEAPSGGDAGPASAVPSFLGLHEFDAFLLVVDGVPWGGAFNPSIPTLDLTDVERIEVLKGSAPVLYGATSFVGVIQVIHYPAGQAAKQGQVSAGTYGSWSASASTPLPRIGDFQQSVALSGKRDGFSDHRESVRALRALYRLSGPLAGGTLRFDADATQLRSVPPSPVPRDGSALNTVTPQDANFNPADARLDENRYHATLGYSHDTPLGLWETTASFATSHIDDVRGFLRPDFSAPEDDTQIQSRNVQDDYFDTHLSHSFGTVDVVWGADLLFGRGTQTSVNGGFTPDLTGATPPPRASSLHVDEINNLSDRRVFGGEYVQVDWKFAPRWDLNLGLRLNQTSEHKRSTHIDGFDPTADTFDDQTRRVNRLSDMVGVSWKAWDAGRDELVIYANYRDAFKPAAIDFGPDNTPDILQPETARSYEAGVKGRLFDGRVDYEAGVFQLDFKNLVVVTTDPAGDPIFQNAGGERLKGFEAEARWHVAPDVAVAVAYSAHDARFTHYVASEGGTNIDVSGNQLTLAPRTLASAGLIWSPDAGLFGSATVSYVGSRYLDLANSAKAAPYTMFDASLGYRWGRYGLSVNGYNLTNTRAPVTQSEFGDESYYLSPARKVFVQLTAAF